MKMCRVVSSCLVLVCLVAMLVEKAEAHITFFSPKEMHNMQLKTMKDREDQKKVMEPRSEDIQFEEISIQQLPGEETEGPPDERVEIAVRLSAKQLEHMSPVLEELIHDMVDETEKAQ